MQISVPLSIIAFFLFFAGYITPCNALAAVPAVHVSPKPGWILSAKPYNKKPSLRTIQRGYFFALIEEQIHVEKRATYNHIIREIVSEAGIQNGSQISVSFEPSFERVDFHNIIVWRNNKPINRLNLPAFKILADEKELSSFIYQGSYSALYILDDIRKGDRIEFSYTITGRNPIFNDKFAQSIYFQGYQPIAHQFTSIIFSDKRKINIKAFNDVPKASVTAANGLKTYAWESFQVPAATEENLQPGWFNTFSHVQVSDYSSWKEVAEWALKINPVSVDLKGELKEEVTKLLSISGNDKEKYFRDAVIAVQDEVRYMGIEIGEYSHRANSPSKVFAQRYGDCKDKSLLLVSLLRANGIAAWMVLVNTTQKGRVDQFLPSSKLFNHAVVLAQLNGRQVWVDATMAYQRGTGTDIYFPDYGKGLVLKPGTTALTAIVPSKAGKINCSETYTITDEKKPVALDVTTTYTLNQADYIRDRLASSGMAETEKTYLEYYAKIYSKIKAADSVIVIDDEKANKLTTIEKYQIEGFFKKDSASAAYTAGFYANYINDKLPTITGQIKTPVAVNYPYTIDYAIRVILDGGWSIKKEDFSIKRDAYKFSSQVSAEADTLTLNYHLTYLQDFIPVNKLNEFKDDIKKISDDKLQYNFTYAPDSRNGSFNLNEWLLAYVVLFIIVFAGLAVWLYRRETPGIVFAFGTSFIPIGGWLILILIGLILTPVVCFVALLSNDYFNTINWTKFNGTTLDVHFKALLLTEITGNLFIMCFAVFCLVMFLNKRDILPRYMIIYFLTVIIFSCANYFLARDIANEAAINGAGRIAIRSLVTACIWIPYFKISTRVKETFIVPYPAKNYRYEEYKAPDE